jgi:signal transduction histidine kinase
MTLVFLVSLSFIAQFVILDSFNKIEQQDTVTNVQRVITNIDNQEAEVAANCKDLAERDDTYAFVKNINESKNPATLNQSVLLNTLNIDYLLIYNTSGDQVFSEGALADDGTAVMIPAQVNSIIKNSIIPNGVPTGISGRRGLSIVGDDPVILAGYAIRGSNPSDPSQGTLVMGRKLSAQRIGNMENILVLHTITFQSLASRGGSPTAVPESEIQDLKKGQILIRPVNSSTITGTTLITGIEDKPTFLVLEVQSFRPMYQQVQTSILIVAAAIIILSALFIITVQLLLQKFVLGPLSRLDEDITGVAHSGDAAQRVPEKGDDEIRSLSHSLNNMLRELQEKRDQLAAARQELTLRNRDLEELNRKANLYLDIYLDVLTYEILNAIMGLQGYAEYLNDTADGNEKKFLTKIIELAEMSNNVIRNIETISKIYKTPPKITGVDLQKTLHRETAMRENADITVKNCDHRVFADDMLGVIFNNLFSNCLKFGGPKTHIEVEARETSNDMLEISVTDTGTGISDAMKPQVFDRFEKDLKTRSSYGLGLHIVKMLVENYGGRVWADDRIPGDPAQGAAIRLTLHLVR